MIDPTEAPLGVPLEAGGNAGLSADGRYRWWLTRWWEPVTDPKLRCCWVMLNPSTADASKNDQTITRCIKFSQGWGFNGMVVVNVFALRATDPTTLKKDLSPIGALNDEYLDHWISHSGMVVAAWGDSYPNGYTSRVREVTKTLTDRGAVCLGKTNHGTPKHPLARGKSFIPYDVKLVKL